MYYHGAGADRQLIALSRFSTRVAKRVFDVLFAAAALTALWLVMVAIAIVIKACLIPGEIKPGPRILAIRIGYKFLGR